MTPPTITPAMQTAAWLVAHRTLLAFLAKKILELDPTEADRHSLDATATMLRNSIPHQFANQPETARGLLVALACEEIARILTAPHLPATEADRA